MLIYRYPARCREKGSKFKGTLRDDEKKGCKSIGTLRDVEIRGVHL